MPRDRVIGWARASWHRFRELASDPATGVRMSTVLDLSRTPGVRPWWADAVPSVRPADPDELPPGFAAGWAFDAPVIDTRRYLPWLLDQVNALGGRISNRDVVTLDEALAEDDVVVNCTGLGARSLTGDDRLYPIRGQLVHVRDPGLARVLVDEEGPDGIAYAVPRGDDCVLGGVAQPGDDDLRARPEEAEGILARCGALDARLRDATRLADAVGLRPGRETVRLEAERRAGGKTIVHDYGHGGAGVTLSWGCAMEVVALVTER